MKALLLGYYGAKNLGDDMMLHCLLRWLGGQGMTVTVVSENTEETEKRFAIPTVRNTPILGEWAWWDSWFRGHALRLIKTIRENEILVVGGGDLIRDDKGWRTFWYTIEKIVLALLFGKRVFLVNIGIISPKTALGRYVLKKIVRKCSKIIVRDESSLRTCLELGCQNTCFLEPDIVLSLPAFLDQHIVNEGKSNGRYILVCLRMEPNDFGTYRFEETEINALATALDEISVSTGAQINFIPFQSDNMNDDNLMHSKILSRMKQKNMAKVMEWTSDLEVLSNVFSSALCVVAMRLHAAVLGAAMGKPVIVMTYDRKVTEFANLVGIRSRIDTENTGDIHYMKDLICKELKCDKYEYKPLIIQKWESIEIN